MKNLTSFALIFCLSCSHTSPVENIEGEKYFYADYPELKDKVSNVKVYVNKEKIRESIIHYRFVGEENILLSFLDRQKYLRFYDKIQDGSRAWVRCNSSFMYSKDQDNVEPSNYPSWWDISSVESYICFIEYNDRPHKRRRAVYDRKNKTLYMYIHVAG
jgi:hypothetical protein